VKVEFRDGEKEIPDYLADMMRGIETYRLTLDEAIQEANRQALSRHINQAADKIVSEHLATLEHRT
jgi:hypothetical protein